MQVIHAQRFILHGDTGKDTTGLGRLVHHGPTERYTKALTYTLGGILLGAVCVMIPVAQLIFPLVFPVVGAMLALQALDDVEHVDHVAGPCPTCGAALLLEGDSVDFPVVDACPHCDHPIAIEPAGR